MAWRSPFLIGTTFNHRSTCLFLGEMIKANEMIQEKAFRPALLDMLYYFFHYG
jgi:hypothetical protein